MVGCLLFTNTIGNSYVQFGFLCVVAICGIIYSIKIGHANYKKFKTLSSLAIGTLVSVISVSAIIFFFVFISILWLFLDDPNIERDDHLNAAIKNTCLLDPKKINCPKDVRGVIAIEPQTLASETRGKYLAYRYFPQTNDYTMIIRSGNQGVIYDPRIERYYNHYVDSINVQFESCSNKITSVRFPNMTWKDFQRYSQEVNLQDTISKLSRQH